jgi:hypothetical protein
MKRFAFFAPVVTAALLAASSAALAQTASSEATARYEQDRQKCMTNNTQDSMATCMREATNALDASRKGQLSDPGPIAAANGTDRCSAFQSAQERSECVRRVESSAVSGSVSGGGVLRESTTTTIIVPAK